MQLGILLSPIKPFDMTYKEIKTAQSLQADRLELLNFLHAVMAHAVNTHQKSLINMGHRCLDRLQNKTIFLTPGVTLTHSA